ncbi:MAG: cbb3-type cytochrome oxidase assembly protein CcoS [Thiomicrorhabdus sp.]|nr:cbb3-type cytochrome oxidase assembly protein CcoS [Thiomicrorhabdus sp.]
MDVIYGLIPMMLVFGFFVVVVFIWMAKTGHFDDLDGAANRIFMDDEYPEDLNKKSDKMKDVELSSDNNLNKKEGGENKLD